MRRGIDERGPIAAWLIRSRALFRDPGAVRPWTVEAFLATLEAETGWAPVRTTYARWESGAARPEAENLQRVVDFYAARGVGGPDSPKVEAPVIDPIVAAIDRLTAAVEAQGRQQQEGMLSLASVLGEVMHALGGLPGRTPGGSAGQSTGAGR